MMNENQTNDVPENPAEDPSSAQVHDSNESQPDDVMDTQAPVGSESSPKDAVDSQPSEDPGQQPDDLDNSQLPEATEGKPLKTSKPSRAGIWISLLVLIAALGLGSMTGYQTAVSDRLSAQSTLVSQQLKAQYDLVQQDLDAGRYSVAQQRLEYIIKQDVNYPGAAEKLAEILVKSAITPSPVPSATPTLTPTPDLRGQEAIYAQAQQQLTAKDWTGLMGSLDSLRKADPAYKAAVIDGMYYTALRNRGLDQILGIGAYKTTNMEGGIYDLTLAERFGPLDGYADGLRNFSRLYIVAASFWDVNWPQAVNYFRQVNQFAPNLRDSSNVTATQRLYQALLKYGDQLSVLPKMKDRCAALDIWSEAGNLSALNNDYNYKFNQLNNDCNPPTEVPTEEPPTPAPNPTNLVP